MLGPMGYQGERCGCETLSVTSLDHIVAHPGRGHQTLVLPTAPMKAAFPKAFATIPEELGVVSAKGVPACIAATLALAVLATFIISSAFRCSVTDSAATSAGHCTGFHHTIRT
jgi:hypothetical protein